MHRRCLLKLVSRWLLLLCIVAMPAWAQDAPSSAEPAAPAAKPEEELVLEQGQLADRFDRLEKKILRLAELTAPSDPRRAAVLRQVVAQSKDRDVTVRFEAIVGFLKTDRLATAQENQEGLVVDLAKLLELLLKEDRASRIESEKRRIQRLLKEVGRIIKEQRGVKARTEGGDDLDRLKDAQGRIAGKTGKLADELAPPESESSNGEKPSDGEQSEGKPGEKKDGAGDDEGDDKKNEQKPKEENDGKQPEGKGEKSGEKQDGDQKPTEGKGEKQAGQKEAGKPGQKSDGQQQPGQQGQEGQQGEPGDDQQNQNQEQDENQRVRKRIQNAQQRMEEAEKKLEEAKRKGAAEEQQKALEELEQAKADLEKILRQLREEEVERMLVMLEARFRKMLELQIKVYEGTKLLDQVPEPDRAAGTSDFMIQAGRLGRQEAEIVHEADRALTLLKEEGSSIAFPETVGQMVEDMEQVAAYLTEAKTGEITQGLEQDIIAALEEMIEALKKAIKKAEQEKGRPPRPGQPQDQPLVDQLAELKMIRALQMRVNKRTERYSLLIDGGQADRPELLRALEQLGDRQQRIHKITRDLHLGKNR